MYLNEKALLVLLFVCIQTASSRKSKTGTVVISSCFILGLNNQANWSCLQLYQSITAAKYIEFYINCNEEGGRTDVMCLFVVMWVQSHISLKSKGLEMK